MLKGRGDKTVAPRSFTPGPPAAPVSSTQRPGAARSDQFRLGSVVVGAGTNTEELSFQPGLKAFKPENYKVTDFSHQTTAQGHTYRCGITSLYVLPQLFIL